MFDLFMYVGRQYPPSRLRISVRGGMRRLVPSGTISAVSLDPPAVLVDGEGSLLSKA